MAPITLVHDCDIERRGDGSAPATLEGDFRDIGLDEANPDLNTTSIPIKCGYTLGKGENYKHHGLILFDLLSFIPADATITAAVWWINVASTSAGVGQPFFAKRCTRTDWVEDEATWNSYKSGSPWTTPGGDMATPEVTLGDITATGWQSHSIKTLVDDAWDDRSGICTFLVLRKPADDGGAEGVIQFYDKVSYALGNPERVHHLRITYTLADRTFQVMVR